VERLERERRAPRPTPEATASPVVAAPLPADARWRERYPSIVGEDERLIHILHLIDRVSLSDSTVLIQGESGTGKELIAEAIHGHSGRASGPFIKVNCAAFVESLLLSELFGHERGAFTGAMSRRKGRFELADTGTLFLDEIGDISANTQVALLRVLQERRFERVGGTETVRVDVRLICATNRNLEEMVREGTFRLDLYYRLKGIVLELPPLRERRRDIPRLIDHFIETSRRDGGPAKRVAPDAMEWLSRYSWPGNVRELENFVRSLLLFVDSEEIGLPDVLQFEDFFADGERAEEEVVRPHEVGAGSGAESLGEVARPTGARRSPRTLLDVDPVVGTEPHEPEGPAAPPVLRREICVAPAAVAEPEVHVAEWALRDGVGLPELKRRLEVEMIRRALVEAGGNISEAARRVDMKRSRLSQIVHATPELEAVRVRLVGQNPDASAGESS
jgi:sigma-54 specific flagellar transcriptional regulator A